MATSNTPPDRLYEGGLNRQLFLPFIAEIKQRLDVVELNGPTDYRLQRLPGVRVYITPLGAGGRRGHGCGLAASDRRRKSKPSR